MSHWRADAACLGMDTDRFFKTGIPDPATLLICVRCPVRRQCLADAMRVEGEYGNLYRFGIWGGLTPKARTQLAKRNRDRLGTP